MKGLSFLVVGSLLFLLGVFFPPAFDLPTNGVIWIGLLRILGVVCFIAGLSKRKSTAAR